MYQYNFEHTCVVREIETRYVDGPLAPIKIGGPTDVTQFFERLQSASQEHFVTLLLDGRHRPVAWHTVGIGTLTSSLVHPREVFGPAVRSNAAAIVIVHNHPSGDPKPSAEDDTVTERLVRAGGVLGIGVLDHIVIGWESFFSYQESRPEVLERQGGM